VALPLRRQIILLNVAIIVPVFAVIGWSARRTYQEQIDHLERETRAVAQTVVAYLERGLAIESVQTVIGAISLPDGTVITVTDANSTVLARSSQPEHYVGQRVEAHPLPISDVPEYAVREGVDDVERVFANAIYPAGPWLVSVGMPTAVAYNRVGPLLRRHLAISVAAAGLTLLLQFLVLRSYTSAFGQAIRFTTRVAAGHLDSPAPARMPSREMEQLQQSFIEMVGRLRDARQVLARQVAEERRVREALESLQRQMIRQERLAATGVLASGVAHELNNPLQAILGFAELLQMRTDLPPDAQAELALIQKESARASTIIRNLSRFAAQQTTEPSPVRLREVIASVVELRQRRMADAGIELSVTEDGNPQVLAVFPELQQVLLNFMINAEQAVMKHPPPRRIAIRASRHGHQARLEVRDNGPGIPREDEPKLFQPFFTTKPVGEGTGLGLSVSYGIIQSHGGTIGYQPAPDGGAVFYVGLPVLEQAARAS
jgi:C4-dicarboxylate-specific signal transduction histidine kinase